MKITSSLRRVAAVFVCSALCLSQVACTKDQVTITLGALVNAAVAAADIALPQDAAVLNQVTSVCIDPALNILESSQTGIQKSVAILSVCSPMIGMLGNSPGLQAVSAALATFLDAVKVLTAEVNSTPAGALAFADSTKPSPKLDKAKLKQIRAQVEQLKAKLAAKKAASR